MIKSVVLNIKFGNNRFINGTHTDLAHAQNVDLGYNGVLRMRRVYIGAFC